jgi:CDP-glucose 4,6-dehydratase
VVVVTSDKCYENQETGRSFVEDDPMGGDDPYSSSKGCAELVASAYHKSFFADGRPCGIATARAGNVIGGGDWSENRIVPDTVRALLAGEAVVLRNPGAIRPWQHVLDPLWGYLLLGARLWSTPERVAGGWNFGPTDDAAVPVQHLVELALRSWGSGEMECAARTKAPHEAKTLRLDSTKARGGLGWSSLLTLEESVALTMAWYRECARDPGRAADLTREQIDLCMARIADVLTAWSRRVTGVPGGVAALLPQAAV